MFVVAKVQIFYFITLFFTKKKIYNIDKIIYLDKICLPCKHKLDSETSIDISHRIRGTKQRSIRSIVEK